MIVHEGGGAIERDRRRRAAAGSAIETDGELLLAMRRLVHDDDLREDLAHRGYAMRIGEWSETAHLDRYFALIQGIKAGRANATPPRPKFATHHPESARIGRAEDSGAA